MCKMEASLSYQFTHKNHKTNSEPAFHPFTVPTDNLQVLNKRPRSKIKTK